MKKIKKILIAMAVVLAALVCVPTLLVQDDVQTVEAATVRLNKSTATLNVGSSVNLRVLSGASGTVTWSTPNYRVASVNKTTGKVTALSMGQATINAKVGGKIVASCKITVNGTTTLNKVGGYRVLSVKGVTGTVEWSTPNYKVVSVDKTTGKVTAKALGRAYVYAKVDGKIVSTCVVTVNTKETLDKKNDSVNLSVKGVTGTVEWSTPNYRVVSVNKTTGKVTALAMGQAVVNAKVNGNIVASCVVTVNGTAAINDVSESKTLSVKGVSGTVTWSTPNYKVVSVDNTGKVTGLSMGRAVVYAKVDGEVVSTCVVTVNDKAELSYIGDTHKLSVKGVTGTVTWSTPNYLKVSVDSTGKVTAKALGTATVYAKVNGETVAKCVFTITNNPVEKIKDYVKAHGVYSEVDATDTNGNTYLNKIRTVSLTEAAGVSLEQANEITNIYESLPMDNETAPVISSIVYSYTDGTLTFKSTVDTVGALDEYGYANGTVALNSVVSMVYDATGNYTLKCAIKADATGVLGSSKLTVLNTMITANGTKASVKEPDLDDASSYNKFEFNGTINMLFMDMACENMGIDPINPSEIRLAARYQGNVAFYYWNEMLEELVDLDMRDFGFTNF